MTKDRPSSYKILYVCTGNTCRSPLAEVITRRAVAERGWDHVEVDSAGTAAAWDAPASDGSLRAASEIGLDLAAHRSQPLTRELVERADIVLAMTLSHLQSVELQGGEVKAVMLGEFLDGPEQGEPIADPFGGTAAEYAEARDRIARAVDGLLDRLSAILAP